MDTERELRSLFLLSWWWRLFAVAVVSVAALGSQRTRRGLLELAGAIKCSTGRSALSYLMYGCYCGLGGQGWPRDRADWWGRHQNHSSSTHTHKKKRILRFSFIAPPWNLIIECAKTAGNQQFLCISYPWIIAPKSYRSVCFCFSTPQMVRVHYFLHFCCCFPSLPSHLMYAQLLFLTTPQP